MRLTLTELFFFFSQRVSVVLPFDVITSTLPLVIFSRAKAWEIPLDTIHGYLDSFKHGAEPHGGGGIGLERVIMLFLDLHNVRRASLFPRDPRRISP